MAFGEISLRELVHLLFQYLAISHLVVRGLNICCFILYLYIGV